MNCWNTLKTKHHNVARKSMRDGQKDLVCLEYTAGHILAMGNQQPSTYRETGQTLERALINAQLGDGHFWRHPEMVNDCIVWTSIHESWLSWKRDNLLPENLRTSIQLARAANAKNCFPNAKALYTTRSSPHLHITNGRSKWTAQKALKKADLFDLAIWYLDDGCCVRRKDTKHSYRVSIAVGAMTEKELFPHAQRILGTTDIGRVYLNNSRATKRNQSWIIPKPAAVQILGMAEK